MVWLLEIIGHSSGHCLGDKHNKKVNVKEKVGMKGPTERYSAEDVTCLSAQQLRGA